MQIKRQRKCQNIYEFLCQIDSVGGDSSKKVSSFIRSSEQLAARSCAVLCEQVPTAMLLQRNSEPSGLGDFNDRDRDGNSILTLAAPLCHLGWGSLTSVLMTRQWPDGCLDAPLMSFLHLESFGILSKAFFASCSLLEHGRRSFRHRAAKAQKARRWQWQLDWQLVYFFRFCSSCVSWFFLPPKDAVWTDSAISHGP